MLEVECTDHRCCTTTGSDRNGNEAVADAASEAFARWLHHRHARYLVTAGRVKTPHCWPRIFFLA